MILYSFVILISIFLFDIVRASYGKTLLYVFPYACFILLLSLLGGLRDETVGTDVMGYGVVFFENAKYTPNLWTLLENVSGEWGFHILVWACARISSDIHFMFFIEELIKIVLVSSTILHFRKDINATLLMFAYLTFFYFTGYSIMRQIFAMSICIYGLRFYFNGEHKKYILICLLAMTFHTSAIFSLLIYLIHFVKGKSAKGTIVIHLAIICLVYLFSISIMNYIFSGNFGAYSEKAELYMEKEGAVTAKTNILIAVSMLLISFVYMFWKIDKNKYVLFVGLIMYNLFFLFMSPQFEVAFRVSWYQVPFIVILYLYYSKTLCHNKRLLLNTLYVVLFSLHFIISSMHGLSGTIPYSSKLMGI